MHGRRSNPLPRWRGFNLLYLFSGRRTRRIREEDFRWIAEWGFDFVRLPMSFLAWVEDADPQKPDPERVAQIDEVVELGQKYGIHVDLNLHRAPGYSVSREREEPYCLWTDQAALDDFCFLWRFLAERYKGRPASELSFNLVNEPADVDQTGRITRKNHEQVVRTTLKAIHSVDPSRLVIADGFRWGNDPLPELADAPLAQSCRGYVPAQISHYQASWADGERFTEPTWPTKDQGEGVWDRERLRNHFAQWHALTPQGVGVHCGECGCFAKTPHHVFLAWFEDFLQILQEFDIGWALWNLAGGFGVLDSGRDDVEYEDWNGHKLDRTLLDLLQRY